MAYSIEDIESTTIAVGNDDEHYGHILGIDGEPYPRVHIRPQGTINVGDGTVPPSPIVTVTDQSKLYVPPGGNITAAAASLTGGGTIQLGAGDYAAFTITQPNVRVEGVGGTGADRQTGLGATRINAPASGWAATIGFDSGGEAFQGIELDHLNFVGHVSGTSLGGLWSGRVSNFSYTNLCASDFPSGHGYYIKGGPASQYGVLRDCDDFECLKGIEVVDHNGVRIEAGTSEYLTNDVEIVAGSFGVIGGPDADTLVISDRVIQFKEVGADLTGEKSSVSETRFEATTTGVILRGSQQSVLPGCKFNNFIAGGTGTAIEIKNTADVCVIYPIIVGSLNHPPVVDAGTNTDRQDGIKVQVKLAQVISATQAAVVPIFTIPTRGVGPGTYMVRYFEVLSSTALAASGSNYWDFQIYAANSAGNTGVGGPFNTQAGWLAYSTHTADLSLSNNNPVSAGDTIAFTVAKGGSAANLTDLTFNFVLVPY